jgi:carbonic anhydrase
MSTEKLIQGHLRFRTAFAANRELFQHLAEKGQHPKVMWIGCSDSRVIPEQITGANPGELFILRNVANLVPPFGPGGDAAGSAIEFAVDRLEVEDMVVCGHSDCGGVKALEEPADPIRRPHLSRWIQLVRPAITQIDAEYEVDEERWAAIARANALLQLQNLRTYACVREAERDGRLRLHAWMYELRSGELTAYDGGSKQWRGLAGSQEVGVDEDEGPAVG